MNDHVSKKFTKKRSLLHFIQIGLDSVGTQPGSSSDSENLSVSFADDRQRSDLMNNLLPPITVCVLIAK